MKPLYLSRIELNDFRTFGKFALDIPPAPGLTLLVGTNGLGKSSFFDGIEWCLSGEVRRFAQHISRLEEADYLTRRDAQKGAHRVSLQFNLGEALTRTATIKPNEAALIGLLKSSDWGDIGDVGAYLAFTHFLGQAAQQRFTSRKHTDQWEALKGPSGIDRLEEVRLALRGAPTTNAFRNRADEEQLRLDQAEKALIAWRDISERLAHLKEANELIGVASASSLSIRLEALTRDLEARTETVLDQAEADLGVRLVIVRQAIQTALDRTSAETTALEPMRAVADHYLVLVPESDPTGQHLADAKTAVIEATSALTTAELAVLEAERAAAAQSAQLTAAEADSERLTIIRQMFGERDRLIREQNAINAERREIASEQTAKQDANLAASARLTKTRETNAQRIALEEQQSGLREIATRAQGLTDLATAHNAHLVRANAAQEAASDANSKIDSLREDLTALDGRIAASAQELNALRAKTSDVADALARLASHIERHDENCPVCSTPFPPGVLQSLAAAAAAEQDYALAHNSRAHQELIDQRNDLATELATAEQAIATQTSEASAAAAALSTLNRAREDVARSLNVAADGDLIAISGSRLQQVSAELSPLLAANTSAAIVSEEAEVASLAAELAALRMRHSDTEQRALVVDSSIRAVGDRLDTMPKPLPLESEIDDLILAQQQTVIVARKSLTDLTTQVAAAHAAEVAARQRLTAMQNQRDTVEARIAAARRDMDAATAEWKLDGFDGLPSPETVQAKASALVRKSADLRNMLNRHSQVAAGFDSLQKQAELQTVITTMESEAGAGAAENPSDHERVLQDRVSSAYKALNLTRATHEAVKSYSEKLKNEADQFSTEFLKPLNDMVENFNRALLSTPGETVEFNADHAVNRTQLGMQLRYADEIDNEIYNRKLPPQLVLSEGQMAANGFSILCAASTAYPWSNWRALLLDDPLQHNDVIHAAAFVDLMRNLVEMQSYQLLMSTHDRAEGEFLARKFDAANLPCTVVELTAPSKMGVLVDSPRHNAAARAIMLSQLDKTG